jgi:hypothetical protein
MKIPIPGKSGSPTRRGRSQSRDPEKKGFPTTPRSIDKQKKILQTKLKKVMEDNLRLKAHNRTLKDTNEKYLDAFAAKDQ